ncbi:MAG: hypothetical protein N4A35_01415 [Flavobacteriales bacterium]|jgi:hypothetical protein|nr:hypothetical protein [Flavobacteriales bacterium]
MNAKLVLLLTTLLLCRSIQAKEVEVTEAFFDIKGNHSQIMIVVYAKVPDTLDRFLRKDIQTLVYEDGLSKKDVFHRLKLYIDLNFILIDNEGDKLKLISVEAINKESVEDKYYMFCYQFGHIVSLTNKLFLNDNLKHINRHTYEAGDKSVHFVTNCKAPEYNFSQPDYFSINYFALLIVVFVMLVLVIIVWKLSKDIV